MRKHNKTKTGNRSPAVGLLIGTGITFAVSLLLSWGLTSLMLKGSVSIQQGEFIVFIIRALAVLVGCLVSTALTEGKVLPIVGITAGGYLLILFALGIVLYDGTFRNILTGILSVLLGAAITCLIKLKPQRKQKYSIRTAK